ncbi:MAG TPA: hypothetical protein VGE60_11615 [Telluria sp.]
METNYRQEQFARIENQNVEIKIDGLRGELNARFDSIDSKLQGHLAHQTRELVVWIFATALGTFVCTVGITSVLLKLSVG